jgi:hypothetical protein
VSESAKIKPFIQLRPDCAKLVNVKTERTTEIRKGLRA